MHFPHPRPLSRRERGDQRLLARIKVNELSKQATSAASASSLERHWAALDEFEGVEYQRVLATVALVGGSQIETYVYLLR